MRPSLLPGPLDSVKRTRNRGFADAALFELGKPTEARRRRISLSPPPASELAPRS